VSANVAHDRVGPRKTEREGLAVKPKQALESRRVAGDGVGTQEKRRTIDSVSWSWRTIVIGLTEVIAYRLTAGRGEASS